MPRMPSLPMAMVACQIRVGDIIRATNLIPSSAAAADLAAPAFFDLAVFSPRGSPVLCRFLLLTSPERSPTKERRTSSSASAASTLSDAFEERNSFSEGRLDAKAMLLASEDVEWRVLAEARCRQDHQDDQDHQDQQDQHHNQDDRDDQLTTTNGDQQETTNRSPGECQEIPGDDEHQQPGDNEESTGRPPRYRQETTRTAPIHMDPAAVE
ncbi:hypothetical protein AK812_SmicGene16713 [Symbiodinium microadriaticum]|uniref:Uncharacterized protein n=1 Tax=Symbiodinium microadriaticum TaxID=2951 RepID=A0A1Q9DZM6_SYMMI|nr:hypothetical protein AK812_SmicGene16713 [Symbiodinium microadriaticum]